MKHFPHFSEEFGPRFLPNPTTTITQTRNKIKLLNWKSTSFTNPKIEDCGFGNEKKRRETLPAVTNRRLCCMRLWARPRGFFFLSCFATLGVWPLTLPARARDPWTLPAFQFSNTTKFNLIMFEFSFNAQTIMIKHRNRVVTNPFWFWWIDASLSLFASLLRSVALAQAEP